MVTAKMMVLSRTIRKVAIPEPLMSIIPPTSGIKDKLYSVKFVTEEGGYYRIHLTTHGGVQMSCKLTTTKPSRGGGDSINDKINAKAQSIKNAIGKGVSKGLDALKNKEKNKEKSEKKTDDERYEDKRGCANVIKLVPTVQKRTSF